MRGEGWPPADIHAFRSGFPDDWWEKVEKEEQRRDSAAFDYDEDEEREGWEQGGQGGGE